jgi:ABC-type glutathione transport system ATPase component
MAGAVSEALRSGKIIRVIPQVCLRLTHAYNQTGLVEQILHQHNAELLQRRFNRQVELTVRLAKTNKEIVCFYIAGGVGKSGTNRGGSMLRVENLRKSYGGKAAVDDLSFQVPAGRIVGLLGPNGAGKTSTLRIIMGLLEANSGAVLYRDAAVGDPQRDQFWLFARGPRPLPRSASLRCPSLSRRD